MRGKETRHYKTQYGGPERRASPPSRTAQPIHLTRKLADAIDGVDLRGRHVGDHVVLAERDARLVVAEGWGERDRRRTTDLIRRADDDDRG